MPNNSKCDSLWITFGDIHDDTGNFEKIPELDQAAGIIVSGDLTNEGGINKAQRILEILGEWNLPILAQTGNMDKPEVDAWLTGQGYNLHDSVRELAPGIAIFGIGGSTPTPFHTPTEYPESAYEAWLEMEWLEARKYPHTILVSHNPPKDTLCDDIGNGVHVGSSAVRTFLEKAQPDICICGHIHEGKATDHIGKTLVINPGTLSAGGYVVICEKAGKLTAEEREIPA